MPLTRDQVVRAALDLVQAEGLDRLSMRTLADRLQIKAASLYWHVSDRDQLVRLLAAALLAEVRPAPGPGGSREEALAICAGLERVVSRRRDSARVLLEVPETIERSQAHTSLSRVLSDAGLDVSVASETATMMLTAVLVAALRPPSDGSIASNQPRLVAVDSGSRGVTLRAGTGMNELVRDARDPGAALPAVIRTDRVIVRRLRGGSGHELELNPAQPWRFQVQAPTWNTTLDLRGIDVREIHIDSGAVRVECVLPPPRGVVPIDISSGVAGVRLRRPPGVAVVADISVGALQLRLDGRLVKATGAASRWESVRGAGEADHYRVRISSGTARVTLEEDPTMSATSVQSVPPPPRAGVTAALNVVLDGVAASRR